MRVTGLWLVVVLMLAATGCGASHSGPKAESYGRDGLLGTSQSNPNLPTSPTYHTYAADVNMIHEAVRHIPGVKDAAVVLRGPNADVKLDLPDDIGIEDAMRIKREAQDSVSRMMPRYRVNVTVSKNHLLNPKGR